MAAPGVLTFVIVGRLGHPIYEADLTGPKEQQAQYLHQFVLHAALDAVDDAVLGTKDPYLKTVDRFNNLLVSAYATPGGARFLLLHDGRPDDAVRAFFGDAYDAYVRVQLNPFHGPGSRIASRAFDARVRALAKRALGAT